MVDSLQGHVDDNVTSQCFNYLLKAATIDRRISGGNLEEYLDDDADNAKLCEFI